MCYFQVDIITYTGLVEDNTSVPVASRVHTITVNVFLPSKNDNFYLQLRPYSDLVAAIKGQICAIVQQENLYYACYSESHTGFDCTKSLNSHGVQNVRTFFKDCAVFPGDKLIVFIVG